MKGHIAVRHAVEEIKGEPHHIVRLYVCEKTQYEYKIGRWPVTEKHPSLDAIWDGVLEAADLCKEFGLEWIAVHSTDKEAFDAYRAEAHADGRR